MFDILTAIYIGPVSCTGRRINGICRIWSRICTSKERFLYYRFYSNSIKNNYLGDLTFSQGINIGPFPGADNTLKISSYLQTFSKVRAVLVFYVDEIVLARQKYTLIVVPKKARVKNKNTTSRRLKNMWKHAQYVF